MRHIRGPPNTQLSDMDDPNETETDRYKAAELWSRSWDAGNYDNAYACVGEDINAAWAERAGEGLSRKAYVLGFWSSYEHHEIPERFRHEALRARGNSKSQDP